jgi:PDZ domain
MKQRSTWLASALLVGRLLAVSAGVEGPDGVLAAPRSPEPITPQMLRHYTYRLVSPRESRLLEYQRGDFACKLTFHDTNIEVQLFNRAARPLGIDWMQARYTDPQGQHHALVCSGKASIDEATRTSQTTVPAGSSVVVRVLPLEGLYARQSTVYENPLLPLAPTEATLLRGRQITLYLPVVVDGATRVHRLDIRLGYVERNVYCGALFASLPQGSPMPPGALVRKVIAGSPAARCGLHDDDVITQLDSTSIDALKPLWDYLAHCKPGQRVRVRVQRGAHELNLELELAAPVEY